jgi:hypothetical protein
MSDTPPKAVANSLLVYWHFCNSRLKYHGVAPKRAKTRLLSSLIDLSSRGQLDATRYSNEQLCVALAMQQFAAQRVSFGIKHVALAMSASCPVYPSRPGIPLMVRRGSDVPTSGFPNKRIHDC